MFLRRSGPHGNEPGCPCPGAEVLQVQYTIGSKPSSRIPPHRRALGRELSLRESYRCSYSLQPLDEHFLEPVEAPQHLDRPEVRDTSDKHGAPYRPRLDRKSTQ